MRTKRQCTRRVEHAKIKSWVMKTSLLLSYWRWFEVSLDKPFHVSKQNRIWQRIKLSTKSHLTMKPDSVDRLLLHAALLKP